MGERTEHVARLLTLPTTAAEQNRLSRPADRKPKGKRKITGGTNGDLPKPDESVLADEWCLASRDRFRRLVDEDRWLAYESGRWRPAGNGEVYDSVARHLDALAQQYLAAAAREQDEEALERLHSVAMDLHTDRRTSAVLRRAAGHAEVHIRRGQLDQHPTLWAAGNDVVIDLLDQEVRPAAPDLLLTYGSNIPYDATAECPTFDRFLAEALPDPERRAYLLRVLGMAMLGEVRGDAHVLPTLTGTGRNGKGTLVRIVSRLFGEYATKVNAASLMERTHEKHATEIAKLRGRRLATAEETGKHARWNVSRINSWTGGDELVGNFMREDEITFMPSHTLLLTTNHRPNVDADETAFWSRYREVSFEVSFRGREDATLEPTIKAHEMPGVLNRVLAGAADYLAHGLAEPEAVLVDTREARDEVDYLARFAAEHLEVTGNDADRPTNDDVRVELARWLRINEPRAPMPKDKALTVALREALGVDDLPRHARADGRLARRWVGVRLLRVNALGPGVNGFVPGLPSHAVPPETAGQGHSDPLGVNGCNRSEDHSSATREGALSEPSRGRSSPPHAEEVAARVNALTPAADAPNPAAPSARQCRRCSDPIRTLGTFDNPDLCSKCKRAARTQKES